MRSEERAGPSCLVARRMTEGAGQRAAGLAGVRAPCAVGAAGESPFHPVCVLRASHVHDGVRAVTWTWAAAGR